MINLSFLANIFKSFVKDRLMNKATKKVGLPIGILGLFLYGFGEEQILFIANLFINASLFDKILCVIFGLFCYVLYMKDEQFNRLKQIILGLKNIFK